MVTLRNKNTIACTQVANSFIDEYMPSANGEFVKIYLYLLRMLTSADGAFRLEDMADHLQCTEKDLMRALKYWESRKLLEIKYDRKQKPEDIIFLPVPEKNFDISESASAAKTVSSEQPSSAGSSSITPDRIRELKKDQAVMQLLFIAEQYLAKTLSATEAKTILYLYDDLHMSSDLIEYLIEYCVSRNHKSIRYMETVALAWVSQGIRTVQMAKENTSAYAREYFQILKSLGITGRNPVGDEVQLMDTWLKGYGFELPLIQEACNRTVMATGQGSFQYTDKILSGWKSKGVRTFEDIQALDQAHRKKQKPKPSKVEAPAPSNRFNNFHQRSYDYDQFEQQLLRQNPGDAPDPAKPNP